MTPAEYGAALLYFTGSKTHNIHLRQLAIDRDLLLNEYGLSEVESEKVVASRTEKEIYAKLDLPLIAPTMRQDNGEIEAAAAGELPNLVQLKDIKGDLHYHTSLSGDGRSTLAEMVEAASARGYQYVAITDHGEDLTINGATRQQMRAQRKKITKLQEKYPNLTILHGCELNIGKTGQSTTTPTFCSNSSGRLPACTPISTWTRISRPSEFCKPWPTLR